MSRLCAWHASRTVRQSAAISCSALQQRAVLHDDAELSPDVVVASSSSTMTNPTTMTASLLFASTSRRSRAAAPCPHEPRRLRRSPRSRSRSGRSTPLNAHRPPRDRTHRSGSLPSRCICHGADVGLRVRIHLDEHEPIVRAVEVRVLDDLRLHVIDPTLPMFVITFHRDRRCCLGAARA